MGKTNTVTAEAMGVRPRTRGRSEDTVAGGEDYR